MNRSRRGTEVYSIEKLEDSKIEYNQSIKVILLGDSNVGKTSIIERLKTNTFKINQPATISLEHYNLMIKVNLFVLRMQIWDTAGQEKFDAITSNYYKSTEVIIFVYAVNLRSSFERIEEWAKQVENNNIKYEDQLRFLVGNKTDLESERQVTFEEGKDMANKIGCSNFIEIIGKHFYSLKNERQNSASFNYIASDSILNPKKKCAC